MSKNRRNTLFALMGSAICAGIISCGTAASNNDQGTSFLAFGWFTQTGTTATPNTGQNVGVNSDFSTITDGNGQLLDGKQVLVSMGLQNRLTSQFVTLKRIDCSYSLEGTNGTITLPNDSSNVSSVLAPAANPTTGEPVLPGAEIGTGSANFTSESIVEFPIISTDQFSYLNVYTNSLPALPFRITATCHGVGVTQAGDTITTNDLNYPVILHDTAECCTGNDGENPAGGTSGGFQGGAATGGGIDFSDGTNSADITTTTEAATIAE
ncbi:MAG: hypothetical protein KBC84_00455 [Proteobacteria bacterium]|nr:hypothetical protein [Pseudomonadota bacterium]